MYSQIFKLWKQRGTKAQYCPLILQHQNADNVSPPRPLQKSRHHVMIIVSQAL